MTPCDRNLDARKEMREKAWQVDGWAETVSKVRATTLLCTASVSQPESDGPGCEAHGFVHPTPTLLQPFEMRGDITGQAVFLINRIEL